MHPSQPSKLSTKQWAFIKNSTAKINVAHGAVRSGKTYAAGVRFIELVLECPDNDIILIGNSFSSIEANVVRPLHDDLMQGYCTWQRGNNLLTICNKRIRVIGANDESSVRAIQGNTHSLAYVDELTTIPTNFLNMLTTRLSRDHSKMIATCNPDSPVHPVKLQFIDSEDDEYAFSLSFEIDDNPALSKREKDFLKTKYSGLFYKRYILGQWVMAEGAIYADFDRTQHVVDHIPGCADSYYVGIDYGANNPFAAVLIGHRSGHTPRFWVEKELYWDPNKTLRNKTNAEYADDIQRFIEGYPIKGLYVDPSAVSFKTELSRRKIRCGETDNEVFAGLTFLANLFSNHQLVIMRDCPHLMAEIEMYVWDAKKALRGDEEPIKKNDHLCDALRYAIYSAFGKSGNIDRRPPAQESARTLGFKSSFI